MTKYSKFNVIYRLQKWLDSVPGQTFMNYAYSWGASIVILGALFKLTHLPGANTMLFLGMGTEVLVFFIAGFDRPFDKTEEGKELPTHVAADGDNGETENTEVAGNVGGGTIIIGGGGLAEGAGGDGSMTGAEGVSGGVMSGGVISGGIIGGVVAPQQQPELPEIDPEEMEEATQNYVEQLKARGMQDAEVYIHNHIVRVIYGSYESEAEAYRHLNKLNKDDEFAEAWVYKKTVEV